MNNTNSAPVISNDWQILHEYHLFSANQQIEQISVCIIYKFPFLKLETASKANIMESHYNHCNFSVFFSSF